MDAILWRVTNNNARIHRFYARVSLFYARVYFLIFSRLLSLSLLFKRKKKNKKPYSRMRRLENVV